jgi:hypothetical protein
MFTSHLTKALAIGAIGALAMAPAASAKGGTKYVFETIKVDRSPDAPGPLSGSWSGTLTAAFGTELSSLSLVQDGKNFSGSYVRLVAGDSPVYKVAGSVSGTSVTLHFTEKGNRIAQSFRGTVAADSNTMSGTNGDAAQVFTR